MLAPILLLAVGAIAAGYAFKKQFVGDYQEAFWGGAIFNSPANTVLEQAHHAPAWVLWSPLVVSAIGFAVAWWVYIAREGMGARIAEKKGLAWTFLYNKWFFDELYDAVFVKGAKALGDFFWKIGDVKIIDGLGPNGAAWASMKSGGWLARFQSGFVYFYAFVMLIGVAAFLAFAIFTWGA